ncbi:hypothetical protein [Bradyrhizobium cosmicum]|uniref:hypothetical protein n=1 Tax=Bradyrhizobium cosmicum TaxID=1404864 RepID=UPI0028EE1616|nr:hypothetical protein [Bradyrhizobium cosmicum]
MPIDWKAYARGVEADIAQIKRDLAPLEDGTMTIGERESGSDWRDVTPETIARYKQNIATYEAILKDVVENRIKN